MLGYDLLAAGKFDLAITIGIFSSYTLKTFSTDIMRRRMVINLSQAYKWSGDAAQAAKVIGGEDWSSCSHEFQLAVAVLEDDFKVAAGLMKTVNAAGAINKNDYRDWPLFTEFRKSQEFLKTYQEIFGHQLVPIEPHPTDTFFGPITTLTTQIKPGPNELAGP
jgi:hypothetical protein